MKQIGTTFPILITMVNSQCWTTADDTQSIEDAILNGNEIICNQVRPVCVPGTPDGLPTRINENQWVALCRFPSIPVYSDDETAAGGYVDSEATTEIDDELLAAAGELADEAFEQPLRPTAAEIKQPACRCWNEGEWGRVHREDCPIHKQPLGCKQAEVSPPLDYQDHDAPGKNALKPWHEGGREQRASAVRSEHERTEGTGDC